MDHKNLTWKPHYIKHSNWSHVALLEDSKNPVIRTVKNIHAQQIVCVKAAGCNFSSSPPFLPGRGVITLLCLQRTPDQTITLSGSQTAPTASDSTDKWSLGPPSHWGERDHTSLEQRQQCILKASFLQFHSVWWDASTAALLAPRSNFYGCWGSEELQGEVKRKCALFSPHSKSVDTVIMDLFWTHCDDPFKKHPSTPPLSSFDPQLLRLRMPQKAGAETKKDSRERRRRRDRP